MTDSSMNIDSDLISEEIIYKKNNLNVNDDETYLRLELSQKKLQEAIIWSELLSDPMCKRRKRR